MKTYNLLLSSLFIFILSASTAAQTHDQNKTDTSAAVTESFKVWGKCDMCKARIEKTVKSEGVTIATWDLKTQLLTVAYDPAKTNGDELSKKLAAAGHDTEKYKASDEVYALLPACCHYERSK